MARTGRPPKNQDEAQARGQRIKALMAKQGVTGNELAKLLNMPPANISRYRSGKREPTGTHLVALAEALGTTAEYIING